LTKERHDNEYILTGYRINFNTIGKSLKSLFMLHNESVNVWSHLIGAFFFVFLILNTYLYLAPPGMNHAEFKDWDRDFSYARERDTAALMTAIKSDNQDSLMEAFSTSSNK
jgi:hypothetical protein